MKIFYFILLTLKISQNLFYQDIDYYIHTFSFKFKRFIFSFSDITIMNPSKKRIRSKPFVPTNVPTNPLEQLMTTTTKDKPTTKKSVLLLHQAKNRQQLDKMDNS